MKEIKNMTDQEIKDLKEQMEKELSEREVRRKECLNKQQFIKNKLNNLNKDVDHYRSVVLSAKSKLIGNCFEEELENGDKSAYYVTGVDGLCVIVDVITKNNKGTKISKDHKKLVVIPKWKPITWQEYRQYLVEYHDLKAKIENTINNNLFEFPSFKILFDDEYFHFGGFLF